MHRKRIKEVDEDQTELDFTSMIDVCFLLIAFFVMVTEVSKSEIVEVFLPLATHAKIDNPPDDRVIVNIDRKGEVWIRGFNYGHPNITENKRSLKQELIALTKQVGYDPDLPGKPSLLTVLVRADAHSANRYVQCVQILLAQVKVMKLHYSAKNPTSSL